jgi:hypothetical protein
MFSISSDGSPTCAHQLSTVVIHIFVAISKRLTLGWITLQLLLFLSLVLGLGIIIGVAQILVLTLTLVITLGSSV